jgi:hypothetical protein
MRGPLNAIRRRRSEQPANEAGAPPPASDAPTQAPSATGAGTTDATQPQPPVAVPAGQDPIAPGAPSFRHRGRLRRRLRYLRRVRELGFRDLGGLVFDQHKFSQPREDLVRGKLAALAALDAELRALEHALGDRRPITELREPGISACPRCGALHGSEARYCPSCGAPQRGPRAMAGIGEAVSTSVGEIGSVAPSQPPAIGPRQEPAPADGQAHEPGRPEPRRPEPAQPEPTQPEPHRPESREADRADEQPTEVVRPDGGNGDRGAVPGPPGDRTES